MHKYRAYITFFKSKPKIFFPVIKRHNRYISRSWVIFLVTDKNVLGCCTYVTYTTLLMWWLYRQCCYRERMCLFTICWPRDILSCAQFSLLHLTYPEGVKQAIERDLDKKDLGNLWEKLVLFALMVLLWTWV